MHNFQFGHLYITLPRADIICPWEYLFYSLITTLTATMIRQVQSNRKAYPPAYHIDIQRNTHSCNQCKGNTDNTQSNRHCFS